MESSKTYSDSSLGRRVFFGTLLLMVVGEVGVAWAQWLLFSSALVRFELGLSIIDISVLVASGLFCFALFVFLGHQLVLLGLRVSSVSDRQGELQIVLLVGLELIVKHGEVTRLYEAKLFDWESGSRTVAVCVSRCRPFVVADPIEASALLLGVNSGVRAGG
jgi:hypothetical protein